MAPKQATLGKFFGGKNNSAEPKKSQSTLAFSPPKSKSVSKKAEKEGEPRVEDEDADVDMADGGEAVAVTSTEANAKLDNETSSTPKAVRTHSKPVLKPSPTKRKSDTEEDGIEEEDDEDDVAPRKRRRRNQDKDVHDVEADKPKATKKEEELSRSPSLPPVKQEATESEEEPEEDEEEDEEDSDVQETEEKAPEKKSKPATKAAKKTQIKLPINTKDPYPDWKAGEPVPYAALCTTFSLIEMTSKRLIIIEYCSAFLRQVLRLTPDDLLPTVSLMINKLAADYAGIELGIGESLIMKAIGEATGRSLAIIKSDQRDIGDLGLVAAKSRSNQPTMFRPKALTIRGVFASLKGIAVIEGSGSQQKKVDGIKKLLSAADAAHAGKGSKGIDITKDKGGPSEAKFIIRFLEGKLRLGLAEKSVLVALSQAMVIHEAEGKTPSPDKLASGEATLKTVYSETPNWEIIVPAMLEHGIQKLKDNCHLQPGIPLKPMLAKPTKSITEVLDRFEGKEFTCEYKYDGERAQIHYVAKDSPEQYATSQLIDKKEVKGLAAIFSRNSEDLSNKYPDILAKLNSWIKPETKSFVLDCETVAWDIEQKKVLPFQQLMTRKRKDVKVEDVKVKVCVYAFDMLFYNGEPVVQKSLRERRDLLRAAFEEVEGEFRFAQYGNTSDIEQIQTLLDESVKASCEGLMVKMLDTADSGYEPSKRSRNWLKVKKDYLAGIGDSLDLVVLGAYYGRGKRTSVYGAFLLACYNSAKDAYETVCNIGTGFSEAILEELHGELSQSTIEKPKPFYTHSSVTKDQPDVWFEPRFVWEVKTADLTLSPRYKAGSDALPEGGGKGISLRFPRFIKRRDDKKPGEATGSKMVVEMYRKQESVTKQKGPSVDDDFEY